MSKQAVILAAGAGNRAKPFTSTRPKCMFEVANRPLLQSAIEALTSNGILDIIIVVGYRKELIYDYLSQNKLKNINIKIIEQKKLLGSSQALLECTNYLTDEDFVVLPADKYYIGNTIKPILNAQAPTMLTINPELPTYATARNSRGQLAIGRFEHAMDEDPIDTRIYSLNKKYFKYMDGYSSINQAFNQLVSHGIEVYNAVANDIWADLVFPWDMITINELSLKNIPSQIIGTLSQSVAIKGNVSINEKTIVGSNSSLTGDICIGKNCKIKENVVIEGSTSIGDSTTIEPFCYISNSIIGKNVKISAGSVIKDSIIDDDTVVGARFTSGSAISDIKIGNEYFTQSVGCMIGRGCNIANNVSVNPGTIIGNNVSVSNNKTLFGNLEDGANVI